MIRFLTRSLFAMLAAALCAAPALADPVPPPTPSPMPSAPTPRPVVLNGVFFVTQALTTNVNAGGNLGNAGGSDQQSRFNISSAFLTVTRNSGFVRFGASAGIYNIPVLGVSGNKTLEANANTNLYGPLPSVYVSLNPNDHLSITAGKLATLIGQESTYTYLNPEIQRGLVWNMETAVSRGVRVTATGGKYTGALEVNDAFYSGRFLGIEGSLALTPDPQTTYQFVFVIPNSQAPGNPTATIANKRLLNFMCTATRGRWTFTPYVLFVQSPQSAALGYTAAESAYGLVLTATFALNPMWSITARLEDLANQSSPSDQSPNADLVGFGPGSGARTFTVTPAYRHGHFLLRADFSRVAARSATPGLAFGATGLVTNQSRVVIESGLQF
jgi:hypothetical protein